MERQQDKSDDWQINPRWNVWVYRMGSTHASNTSYYDMPWIVRRPPKDSWDRLDRAGEYFDLSSEQMKQIGKICLKYVGPKKGLLKKIDEALKKPERRLK